MFLKNIKIEKTPLLNRNQLVRARRRGREDIAMPRTNWASREIFEPEN